MDEALDAAIAAIANRQNGNITRLRLLKLGLGPDAIAYRLRIGRLHREYVGVYSVGRPARTPHERGSAAVLACGPGAVLSHAAALALWGFVKDWPPSFEVTVTGDRRPAGITVHRSRTLTRQDVRRHHGVPVTSPARTLLDCAPALRRDGTLTRTVNDALLTPFLNRSSLRDFASASPFTREPSCWPPSPTSTTARPDLTSRTCSSGSASAFTSRVRWSTHSSPGTSSTRCSSMPA